MTAVEDLFSKYAQKRKSRGDVDTSCDTSDDIVGWNGVEQEIVSLIESNEVVVFSKSYCPYCTQAKMALRSIPNLDVVVVEMDDGAHENWQIQVAKLAKSRAIPESKGNNTNSVPQIFIQRKCIGGADDLADMFADNRLSRMLGRPLYN